MFLFYFVIFVCLLRTLLSLEKNLTSNTEIYCLGLIKQTKKLCDLMLFRIPLHNAICITISNLYCQYNFFGQNVKILIKIT